MVSISACHAEDPGSIPGRGVTLNFLSFYQLNSYNSTALQPHKRYQVLGSIVVSISACHAKDPGSIPGRGVTLNFLSFYQLNSHNSTALQSHKTYQVLGSIVVSISACHAEDPGSIPGRGVTFFIFINLIHIILQRYNLTKHIKSSVV